MTTLADSGSPAGRSDVDEPLSLRLVPEGPSPVADTVLDAEMEEILCRVGALPEVSSALRQLRRRGYLDRGDLTALEVDRVRQILDLHDRMQHKPA